MIQKYKKRICLDRFVSRIPSSVKYIKVEGGSYDNSWGNIPKDIVITNDKKDLEGKKRIKYNTLINLYNLLLQVVINANYFELDIKGRKWIRKYYKLNDIFNESDNITYASEFPIARDDKELGKLTDKMVIGITSDEGVDIFYNQIKYITDSLNELEDNTYQTGFQVLDKINEILGKINIPSEYDAIYVPKSVFLYEIPKLIKKLEDLSKNKESWKTCCDKQKYEDYGGDEFLNYLKTISLEYNPKNIVFDTPTLDIPILLTNKILDLGMYKSYDVQFVDEDGKIIEEVLPPTETKNEIVTVSGLSKLHIFKKIRNTIDDHGRSLPGVYDKKSKWLTLPYQVGVIKNIQTYNNDFFGDVIYSIEESCTPTEQTYEYYNNFCSRLFTKQDEWKNNSLIHKGTINNPLVDNTVFITNFGGDKKNKEYVTHWMEEDLKTRLNLLKNNLIKHFNSNYPNKLLCLEQAYSFTYTLTYGIKDGDKFNGETVTETIVNEGIIYYTFEEPKIKFTYVLGGLLKNSQNGLVLNELSPYSERQISPVVINRVCSHGIWYQEEFPLKKHRFKDFEFYNEDTEEYNAKTLYYDEVVFNVDNVNKNNIICNNIKYKGNSYKKLTTTYPVFRDEKALGVTFPPKQENDVVINRGMSAAFERHLQLSEIKTWDDLEKYRNGSFLNN